MFPKEAPDPLGIEILRLIIEPPKTAVNKAKHLIEQTEAEILEADIQQNVIELIQDIIVYKFPQKPRKEIEAMFGLEELKKTRYYQDVAEEEGLKGELRGKLKAVPLLVASGLTVQQIAQSLEIDLALVQETIKPSKKSSKKTTQ